MANKVHPRHGILQAVLCLLAAIILSDSAPCHGAPDSISILYIEANTGDSSGGHAALRAGGDVFHYQHAENGLLVLHRERFDNFRHFYNDLGNRNIHEVVLDLPKGAPRKIWEHFVRTLTDQQDKVYMLAALEEEAKLLKAMQYHPERIPVRGAGLFDHDGSPRMEAWAPLSRYISSENGQGTLERQLTEAEIRLKVLLQESKGKRNASSIRDTIYLVTALQTLIHMPGINPKALVEVSCKEKGGFSFKEIEQLERWKLFFQKSVTGLLRSRRPDRGFALLVACARYLAIQHSLKTGRLSLLTTASPECIEVDGVQQAGGRKALVKLALSLQEKLCIKSRQILNNEDEPDEIAWSIFENLAWRYAEIDACARGVKEKIRIYSGTSLPSASAPVDFSTFTKNCNGESVSEDAQERYADLLANLNKEMGYNLFTSNCVTEIFRNLETALTAKSSVDESFEEIQNLCRSISFIPWRMFQQITNNTVSGMRFFYPSWRTRQLALLYSRNASLPIYLRECNTITAQTYKTGRTDNSFLFFTQEMPLIRPLYGALNLVWGAARAVAGVFMTPVDSGTMLKSGAYGILFSLPELCFINIRKGTYSLTETDQGKL